MKKKTFPTLVACLTLAFAVSAAAQESGGATPKPYIIENNELKLKDPVVFADRSDKLLPQSEKALGVVKDFLTEKTYITLLRVEGHTDADGGDAAAATNQQLSGRRALAIARWLVEKGVDCKRLLPVGFGGTKPLAPNDTAENRNKNRRIAFAFAALRGRLIGGLPEDGGGEVAHGLCPK